MAKKLIQQEREKLRTRLSQAKQNINTLEIELDKQQTVLLKLMGALEYHEILFPAKDKK